MQGAGERRERLVRLARRRRRPAGGRRAAGRRRGSARGSVPAEGGGVVGGDGRRREPFDDLHSVARHGSAGLRPPDGATGGRRARPRRPCLACWASRPPSTGAASPTSPCGRPSRKRRRTSWGVRLTGRTPGRLADQSSDISGPGTAPALRPRVSRCTRRARPTDGFPRGSVIDKDIRGSSCPGPGGVPDRCADELP